VAQRPSVRWNEGKQRWMAWVRFPDGSRRKVERVEKVDAEKDLNELLALRAQAGSSGPRRLRLATFGEVMDAWVAAGCPKAAVSRNSRRVKAKSPNTLATIGYLFDGHVRPQIGGLRVDRTQTPRVEQVFAVMADGGYATSTIDHAWTYLNQALLFVQRRGMVTTNPAADVLLPEARSARKRKSFTLPEVEALLRVGIPQDRRPALWMTGLTSGLRPGELVGLRWPYLDIDSDEPCVEVAERAAAASLCRSGAAENCAEGGDRVASAGGRGVAAASRRDDHAGLV
jgi:integrase